MKKIYILTLTGLMVSGLFGQAPNPMQNAGPLISVPSIVKPSLTSRATGTYYLDYAAYDQYFLSSSMQNVYYGNLQYSKVDTAFGAVPFVAEYYDTLLYSDDPTNAASWQTLGWNNVASMTVDS